MESALLQSSIIASVRITKEQDNGFMDIDCATARLPHGQLRDSARGERGVNKGLVEGLTVGHISWVDR